MTFTLKMSDVSSSSSQQDIDKIIKKALKIWEKLSFKNINLWETFQNDFKSFTEEDFKSASIYYLRKLWDYAAKVWHIDTKKRKIQHF